MNEQPGTITVGQLRDALAEYPDDAPLYFGTGDLDFYRVRNRKPVGGYLVQIEFDQFYKVAYEVCCSGE
ncbi:hypothetical protein AGMMS50256_21260 [Betaproteobacteria bacterium]|nr:hypothetical protein AGMMS50256_21260 [Betaproteobacteria bacterium]